MYPRLVRGQPPAQRQPHKVSGIKARYISTMEDYAWGVLSHVQHRTVSTNPSLEAKIESRRESAGVSPLYHLVEYCHQLRVPDFVFDDPVIQLLETLGMDMVFM